MSDDTPQTTFADLGLEESVLKAVREVGYENPSPIQAETIPLLMSGRDVVGLAPEEVCEMLEITDGNQRVMLHRARARVRDALLPATKASA